MINFAIGISKKYKNSQSNTYTLPYFIRNILNNFYILQSVTLDILVLIATFPALSVNLGTDVEAVVFQNALMSFATLSKDV